MFWGEQKKKAKVLEKKSNYTLGKRERKEEIKVDTDVGTRTNLVSEILLNLFISVQNVPVENPVKFRTRLFMYHAVSNSRSGVL